MTKKTVRIIVFLTVAIVAIAVGLIINQRNGASIAPAPAQTGTFRVALVVSGPLDGSGGWNSVGKAGVQLIEKELGVQISYSENVAAADFAATLRKYAQDSYDLVVGYGDEFVEPTNVVAKEFPKVNFAVVAAYGNNNANLGALSFRAGEMGYLLGTVAAVKSKTNKVAYIGGQDFPVMKELATQYERGAKAYNPKIEVSVQWVGNWYDAEHASAIAQDFIGQGFDVLAVNAGGSDSAVFKVAEAAGIYAIGSGSDLHETAPKTILTSAVLNVPQLMLEGVTLAQAGRWQGKQYSFGIQEGTQKLAPFYGLLTAEEEKIVSTARDGITSGKIDITSS